MKKVLKNYEKFVENQFEKNARKALASVVQDIVADVIAEIGEVGAVDTRSLIASITASPIQMKGKFLIVNIFTDKEYAGIVEYGRRPGEKPPPLRALIGWANRKQIIRNIPVTADISSETYSKKLAGAYRIIKNAKQGGGASGSSSETDIDPVVKDFLILLSIQKAIGKMGIEGRFPMTKILNKRKKTLKSDFRGYYFLFS